MTDRITQAREALTEDEAAAHFFPSDLEIFKTGEHTATAFSIPVGSPDERSVPVFTLEQIQAAIESAAPSAAEPVALEAEYADAVKKLAADKDMSEATVLRAAIRLYQAESMGLVSVVHQRESLLTTTPVPQVASEPAKVRACIACAMRDAAIDQPPSQEVTPAYLEWLKTKSRSAGVAGNEAWNAGVEWALTQAETSATASGDAEREAASWRAMTEAMVDEYLEDYEMVGEDAEGCDACYTPSEDERALIKDAVMGLLAEAEECARAALHSTGKPQAIPSPAVAPTQPAAEPAVQAPGAAPGASE